MANRNRSNVPSEAVNTNNLRGDVGNIVNQSDSSNLSVNAELVRGILNHFQSLQIFTTLPTYNGDRGNPAEFVERLEKYFKKTNRRG